MALENLKSWECHSWVLFCVYETMQETLGMVIAVTQDRGDFECLRIMDKFNLRLP